MEALEPLVGRWRIEVPFAPGDTGAWTTFEWTLGGRYLLQRWEVPHPEAPDGLAVIAPAADGDGFTQHYFDSRGVVRLYDMTLADGVMTLRREKPDFSDFSF